MTRGLLLLYATLVPFVPQLPIGPAAIGLVDLLFAASLVVVLARGSVRMTLPLVGLTGLVAVSIVSTLWIEGDAQGAALLRSLRFAAIAVPFALASTLHATPADALRIVRGFAIGGAISIAIGIVIFAFQIPFGPVQTFRYPNGLLLDRAGGIFTDSSAFGHLIATWLTTVVAFAPIAFGMKRRRILLLLLGALGLAAVALYGSLSRSAFIGLAGAGLVALLLPMPKLWRTTYAYAVPRLLAIGAVAVLTAALVAPSLVARTTDFLFGRLAVDTISALTGDRDQANLVTSGRVANWLTYLGFFEENPVSGIGYKALRLDRGVPPDNNYLAVLVETGVAGAIAFAAFLGGVFMMAFLAYARGSRFGWPLLVLWAGQAAMGVAIDFMTFWGTMPAVMALTALCLIASERTVAERATQVPRARPATVPGAAA